MISTKRTLTLVTLTVLVAGICLAGSARAGDPDAYEDNDTVGTAWAITPGTYELNIYNSPDDDYFNITIIQGYAIKIDIVTNYGVTISLSQPAGLIKSVFVASTDSITHTATYTGNHTIRASGNDNRYNLTITLTPPDPVATPGYEATAIVASSCLAITAVYVLAKRGRKMQY